MLQRKPTTFPTKEIAPILVGTKENFPKKQEIKDSITQEDEIVEMKIGMKDFIGNDENVNQETMFNLAHKPAVLFSRKKSEKIETAAKKKDLIEEHTKKDREFFREDKFTERLFQLSPISCHHRKDKKKIAAFSQKHKDTEEREPISRRKGDKSRQPISIMRKPINISVRIKPSDEAFNQVCLRNEKIIRVHEKFCSHNFRLTKRGFDNYEDNEEIGYHYRKRIVDDALLGYNTALMTVGGRRSGKTYTLFGNSFNHEKKMKSKNTKDYDLVTNPGVVHVLVDHLFNRIEEECGSEFRVFVSIFEIVQDKVKDLLSYQNAKPEGIEIDELEGLQKLRINEKENVGTYIENLTVFGAKSKKDLLTLIEKGIGNQKSKKYDRNLIGHLFIQIYLTSFKKKKGSKYFVGERMTKISFIDLGGFEKNIRSEDPTITKNRNYLNLTYHNLNKILSQITNQKESIGTTKLLENPPRRSKYINFRDSRATHLIKDLLIGDTKTYVLGCVDSNFRNTSETLLTLNLLKKLKTVKTKVKKQALRKLNIFLDTLQREIETLQIAAESSHKLNQVKVSEKIKKYKDLQDKKELKILETERLKQLNQQRDEIAKLKEEINLVTTQKKKNLQNLKEKEKDIAHLNYKLKEMKREQSDQVHLLSSENDQKLTILQRKIETYQKLLIASRNEVSSKSKFIAELNDKLSETKKELKTKQKAQKILEESNFQLKRELLKIKNAKEVLKGELKDLKTKTNQNIKLLKKDNEFLNEKCNIMKDENSEIKKIAGTNLFDHQEQDLFQQINEISKQKKKCLEEIRNCIYSEQDK